MQILSNKMHKTLACIVTYNPDIELLKTNINSFIKHVDDIVIVDNNSHNLNEIYKNFISEKIFIIQNNENIGIAAALNQGLDEAVKKQAKFILTMDQDSFFEENGVLQLKNKIKDLNEKVAIIGPSMKDVNSNFTEHSDKEINFVKTIITSGALCRTDLLKEVNGWDEKLFIDSVDFDMCYKLQIKGYSIVKINNIFLNHNLGESVKKKFIIKFLITNHSPLRVYYQFRNTFYLQKIYYKFFFKDMVQMFFSSNKKLLGILLYEKDKIQKIKYAMLGIWDGLNNNYGKKRLSERK